VARIWRFAKEAIMYVRNRFTVLATAVVAGAMAVTAFAGTANAVTSYDSALLVPPGVYYGTGNPNSGFTVNTQDGVELGLGTQMRFGDAVAPSPITGNIYYVPTGYYPSTTDALWNFRFSVNLQAGDVAPTYNTGSTTTTLTISDLFNAAVSFNPFTALPDNALFSNTGFQNSENIGFGGYYNPLIADIYTITLHTVANSGADLGSVTEIINATTPIPAALPLFASGLGVMGWLARRRKQKNAAAIAAA
jgi:hypothetical protein